MKLDKNQLPQLIVLAVLVIATIGYVSFQFMKPGGPSTSPASTETQGETHTAKKPGSIDYSGQYKGSYVVSDDDNNSWIGEASIRVDEHGVVAGHVWLPGEDNKPGTITYVDGNIDKSGGLTIRSGKSFVGGPDLANQKEEKAGVEFSHTGKVQKTNDGLIFITDGSSSDGLTEQIRAEKQVTNELVSVTNAGPRRDPFIPQRMPFGQPKAEKQEIRPVAKNIKPRPDFNKNLSENVPPITIKPMNPFSGESGQKTTEPDFAISGVVRGENNVAVITTDSGKHVVKQGQTIDGRYKVLRINDSGAVLVDDERRIKVRLGGSNDAG